MIRVTAIISALFALTLSAFGQIKVDLRLNKKDYLHGEAILADITISNFTASDLEFQGTKSKPWLDFIVSSGRGVPMSPARRPAFGVTSIPSGKSVSKTIDLTRLYAFSELGNFSIYAVVREHGAERRDGYQSKRHLFNIAKAAPYWTKAYGHDGRAQEYRLIHFNSQPRNQFYAQIVDKDTGSVLRTHLLGDIIMVRKPTAALDGALNMHVLFMVNPSFWAHVRVAPSGEIIGRELYRPGSSGSPRLAMTNDGVIQVVGGSYYDAAKEAAERDTVRKASDRPDIR